MNLIEEMLEYAGILKESISYESVALKIKANQNISPSDIVNNIRRTLGKDSFESDGKTLKFNKSGESADGLADGVKAILGNRVSTKLIDSVCDLLINSNIKGNITEPSKSKRTQTFIKVPNNRWGQINDH